MSSALPALSDRCLWWYVSQQRKTHCLLQWNFSHVMACKLMFVTACKDSPSVWNQRHFVAELSSRPVNRHLWQQARFTICLKPMALFLELSPGPVNRSLWQYARLTVCLKPTALCCGAFLMACTRCLWASEYSSWAALIRPGTQRQVENMYLWMFFVFSGSRTYWFAITTSYCHLLYFKKRIIPIQKITLHLFYHKSTSLHIFCASEINSLEMFFIPTQTPSIHSVLSQITCVRINTTTPHMWVWRRPQETKTPVDNARPRAPNPKNNSRRRPKTPNSHDPSGPRPRLTKTPGPLTVHSSIREGGHTQEHVSQWKQLFHTLLLPITTTKLT